MSHPPSTSTPAHHVPSLAAVLRQDIPWETYLTARLIQEEDLAVLRRVDRAAKAKRAGRGGGGGDALARGPLDAAAGAVSAADAEAAGALVAVLHGVTKDDTVQHALALLETEVVGGVPARAADLLLLGSAAGSAPPAASVLVRLLGRPDWFAQEHAAGLLAAALAGAAAAGKAAAPYSAVDLATPRSALLDWALAQLRRPAHPARSAPAAAGVMARLLRDRAARPAAVRAGAAPLLVPLIRAAGSAGSVARPPAPSSSSTTTTTPAAVASPQLAYDACVAAWLMALDPAGAAGLEAAGAVPALVGALRAAAKEKAVRAAALALLTLLGGGGTAASAAAAAVSAAAEAANAPPGALPPPPSTPADTATVVAAGAAAVEAGLERAVAARAAQAWADPDLPPLLAALGAAAAAAAEAASTWEAYRCEVLSGRLRWGPAHTSPAFWADHGARLEDRGLAVLKVLVTILQAGTAGGGGGGGGGGSTAGDGVALPSPHAAVDAVTLAVACADVASYLAAVPHGRAVVGDLGGKGAAMRLLAHADPEVRRHALAAVQRLVLPREVFGGGGGVGEVIGGLGVAAGG